jgi:hypothetical protein
LKILFVCPILDIRYEWFISFTEVWEQLKQHKVEKYMPYRRPLHIVDNNMAKKAIEGNFDYVLRMDDDVWDIPPNALEKLIEAKKDFISAVMYANGFPYQRCAFIKENKEESLIDIARNGKGGLLEVGGEGVVPVDMSAFPFTLIKTSVFRDIKPPWFEHAEGVPPDSYFCQKMLDAGIQPFVHMDVQVNHRGVTYWNRRHRFLADFEIGIACKEIDTTHKHYYTYEKLRKTMLDSYSNNRLMGF